MRNGQRTEPSKEEPRSTLVTRITRSSTPSLANSVGHRHRLQCALGHDCTLPYLLPREPVRLTLVLDVFGVFMSIYADGSKRQWTKPTFEATDITRFNIIDAPAILTKNQSTGRVLIVAESPNVALDYQLQVKGGVDSEYVDAGAMPFTPLFSTTKAMVAGWTDISLVMSGGKLHST